MHIIHCTDHQRQPLDFVFEPVAHDLFARPQRPGHLCEPMRLAISPTPAVVAAAQEAGIPLELYVVLTVEMAHAVEVSAAASGCVKARLLEELERRVRSGAKGRELTTELARPLQEYALALEQGVKGTDWSECGIVTLTLTQEQGTTWTRAALATSDPLDLWVARHLEQPIADVHLIEAQAARNGQTLREWVALEAARTRCSCASHDSR